MKKVVYEGLYDNKSFDNTIFFELKHDRVSSKDW